MTYQLASFRLRSVGERSARFTDLTLNTTQPRDGVSCPADSVFWLRNGGGKSSLLSLFYALMLPRVVDFMGRAVKRSLTDYVDATDTSHTIAVWHSTGSRTLLGEPEHVLVTGAVYEWAELRRPVDPDKARDRLHTDYYAFYAHPGVLDADSLPVTKPNGDPVRSADFLAALRQIADQHPQALELITTDKQYTWQIGICQVKRDTSVQFIWGWASGWLIQAWVGMAGGWGRRPNRAGLAWWAAVSVCRRASSIASDVPKCTDDGVCHPIPEWR